LRGWVQSSQGLHWIMFLGVDTGVMHGAWIIHSFCWFTQRSFIVTFTYMLIMYFDENHPFHYSFLPLPHFKQNFLLVLIWDRVLPCTSAWSWTHCPPASAFSSSSCNHWQPSETLTSKYLYNIIYLYILFWSYDLYNI
jgi:hypothetical protein